MGRPALKRTILLGCAPSTSLAHKAHKTLLSFPTAQVSLLLQLAGRCFCVCLGSK